MVNDELLSYNPFNRKTEKILYVLSAVSGSLITVTYHDTLFNKYLFWVNKSVNFHL